MYIAEFSDPTPCTANGRRHSQHADRADHGVEQHNAGNPRNAARSSSIFFF